MNRRSWLRHAVLALIVCGVGGVVALDVLAAVSFSPDNRVRVSVTADQDSNPPNGNTPAEFKQRPSQALPGYENIDFWIQVCCLIDECAPDPLGIHFTKITHVKASGSWISTPKTHHYFCEECVDYHVVVYHNMAATGGLPASAVKAEIDAWCYCCGSKWQDVTADPSYDSTTELDPTPEDPDPWDE